MTRIGTALLALGLACTALAGAVFPLAVLGEFGALLFPIGFVLSVVGILLKPRNAADKPVWPILLSLLGLLLLAPAAFYAGSLGYSIDIHRIRPGIVERSPTAGDLAVAAALAIAAALFLTSGVRQRTQLSLSRSVVLAAATFAAAALAFALFFVLDRFFPLVD